jgi:hypothetical protein
MGAQRIGERKFLPVLIIENALRRRATAISRDFPSPARLPNIRPIVATHLRIWTSVADARSAV